MNILAPLPETGPEEALTAPLDHPAARIERIVSRGHATPADQSYDQDRDEWLALLADAARLWLAVHLEPR